MSTGKRLAKRSIVGTKVVVLGEDGLYYPGVIQAVKTAEIDQGVATGGNRANAMPITKYAVRIDINRQLHEYSEVDLIGPGFQNTSGITLKAGQRVYVTFAGREVAGHVTKHRPDVDEVHVTLQGSNSNTIEIVKRMDEIRLMESRKSLRLMESHDVDFARLAEGGHTASPANADQQPAQQQLQLQLQQQQPRKRNCSNSTSGIDVPGAYVGSRKRRSSPTCSDVIMDEDEDSDVMDECAAAMVLMRLSCSPHSPRWEELAAWQSNHSSSSSSGAVSWRGSVSSSGDSPPHAAASTSSGANRKAKCRSTTPSPPLVLAGSAPASFAELHKYHTTSGDDGIVSDESISESDETQSNSQEGNRRVIYQCTWPGCSVVTTQCAAIESHVRSSHLGPRQIDEEVSDHEEEFYYTEVEECDIDDEDANGTDAMQKTTASASTTPLPLAGNEISVLAAAADAVAATSVHDYAASVSVHPGLMTSSPPTLSHMDMARPPHEDPEYQRALFKAARPIAIPARVRSISWSSGFGYGAKAAKVVGSVVSPKAVATVAAAGGATTVSVKSSPVRRPRGEAKKCRKVYGMEHREQWCTQCKWKKACTRFDAR